MGTLALPGSRVSTDTVVVAPGGARGQLLGGLQKTQVTEALLSPGSCPGDLFTCRNKQCVSKENPECDGQKDCSDASDEKDCGESLAAGLLGSGDRPQVTRCSRNSTGLLGTVLQGQLNFLGQ